MIEIVRRLKLISVSNLIKRIQNTFYKIVIGITLQVLDCMGLDILTCVQG